MDNDTIVAAPIALAICPPKGFMNSRTSERFLLHVVPSVKGNDGAASGNWLR
jgi:hypothetical protein